MKIIAVGDIMPGGILSSVDKDYVAQNILDYLQLGDVRIGTLETAIGNEPSFNVEKMNRQADVIYAKDCDLKKLKDLNINIVSLANNHFFDLGPKGATHTIKLLDELGIKHIGAGSNIQEASKPVVVTKDGKTFAFLAFCDWHEETVGWCPFATENDPGVNPMYEEYVVEEIKKNKQLYDCVIVMPHWGVEHTYTVSDKVYSITRIMLNAGADLIMGSHPHRVQSVVRHRKSIVAYSLSNFLFPDRLITKPRSTYYPESSIDISSLPHTDAYPYVDTVTYKIWKPLARIGMIVNTSIGSKKISSEYKLVELDYNNCLHLLDRPFSVKVHLSFNHFLLKYTPYKFSYFCVRAFNSLKYKMKNKMKKICHK